jgi:hypothetical protein
MSQYYEHITGHCNGNSYNDRCHKYYYKYRNVIGSSIHDGSLLLTNIQLQLSLLFHVLHSSLQD